MISKLPIFKHISEVIDDYDLFLFDLWGVIIEGEIIHEKVVKAINKVAKYRQSFFVSNAPRPAFVMRNKLESWGLQGVTEEMIITSGDIARKIIRDEVAKLGMAKPVIYHLGDINNNDILAGFEYIPTHELEKADFLLLSLHRDEDENIDEFDEILKAAAARRDLVKICANPDRFVPTGNGRKRYCAGYFADIIEQYGGEVIYTGKPKSIIYDTVFAKAKDIQKDRILMIGDSFETDIQGARDAGIESALVMTGNAYKIHAPYGIFKEKLAALGQKASELSLFPSFITELS